MPGAAAVLSAAQQEQLRRVSASSDAEAGVVAFMTPILAQCVQEAWAAAGAARSGAPGGVLGPIGPTQTASRAAHTHAHTTTQRDQNAFFFF